MITTLDLISLRIDQNKDEDERRQASVIASKTVYRPAVYYKG